MTPGGRLRVRRERAEHGDSAAQPATFGLDQTHYYLSGLLQTPLPPYNTTYLPASMLTVS